MTRSKRWADFVALDMSAKNFAGARSAGRPMDGITAVRGAVHARRTHATAQAGDWEVRSAFSVGRLELDSGYVAAYGALGQLYMVQGKLEAARKEFDALATQSPKSVAAHTMVAVILQSRGQLGGRPRSV